MKAILLGPLQTAALCRPFSFSDTYSYPESLETCIAFASGYPIANVGNPSPHGTYSQGFPKRRIRLEAVSTPKIEFDFVK